VIGRRDIPERYLAWNRRRGAPAGRRGAARVRQVFGERSRLALRYGGEYAHQAWNNDTRTLEYPYVFAKVIKYTGPGAHLVEIGGGLSGLQFTLARAGRAVVNVDPGPARGWVLDPNLHRQIGAALKAPVQLHADVLSTYQPVDGGPDLVYSVSALEHFSASDLAESCAALKKLLPPGGIVVLTVDLFLDLTPFTACSRNEHGTNIDLSQFLSDAGLVLIEGNRAELHGFPEFSSEDILRRLQDFYVGRPVPTLTQCLVAQRSNDYG
jgi:SAM-dependent methyltransferase